ncbi:MmgE/PrpD family protein [Actinomadura sp. SCN-SB]|uniref:MmgE/PrpD family protein n=1 Tax=Actinomadura sp. SCN-SB TaxID=3373092 RepID=UPI003750C51B
MNTSPTDALAASVARLAYGDLPGPVVTLARQCVLDTLGVAIAGAAEPVTAVVRDVALDEYGVGRCMILGTDGTASGAAAALVNATAAHALDYDDLQMDAMGGHPSAPLLPAVLAAAEESGASGRDVLTAFVAGFEAQCRIGKAVGSDHYRRGFHTTATIGTLGAAAGVARLLGLDAAKTAHALGAAALSAAGLRAMFGTMGKPLQVGRSASSGFLAARWAARGFTGPDDALFCPQGFATTLAEDTDPDAIRRPFGAPWHILRVLFKAHASCYGTHASIEAVLRFREQETVTAENVEEIEVRVPSPQFGVCAVPRPSTGLEGKFSLTFTAALALVEGSADESRFTDAAVRDPQIAAVAERVTVVADDALPPLGAAVTARLRDGPTVAAEVDAGAPGWSTDPAEQDERLARKFRGLVAPILGADAAETLADLIGRLEAVDDIRTLTKEIL